MSNDEGISKFIQALTSSASRSGSRHPLGVGAQLEILKAFYDRASAGPTHAIGSIVTPRADSGASREKIGLPYVLIGIEGAENPATATYHVAYVCDCGENDVSVGEAPHWVWETWFPGTEGSAQ